MKWNHSRGPGAGGPGPLTRAVCVAIAVVAVSGCRQDMHNQPKYRPLRPSAFFEDGSSARQPVEGTIARGTLVTADPAFFTGKVDNQPVAEMPFPVTQEVVDRGQNRYDIFCAPCHDRTGAGNGMVVQRGYRQPPSFHSDRMRQAPAGHYFDVISNGFGAMPDYRVQLVPRDRWAIVAYIRALQLSQQATQGDVPEAERGKLSQPGGQPAPIKD
jgi:mono/diheme cytochrome c family protein